jgi:hypothetical protein
MRFPGAFARRPVQSVRLMFIVALLYRLVVGIHFLRIGGITCQWTNEMAAIAHSLVLRHSFAGAYRGYTGPTAWAAPVYPFLVAAVFRVFGIDSQASAVVLLLLNTVVSSLTAVVIYKLGREYFSGKVGLIAGWAWALSPLGVLMPLLLWDTSLSALVLSLGLLVLLRANSVGRWVGAGALWGASALVNPALLASLPAMLVARLWKVPGRARMGLVFCLTLICVLVPWSIRNRVELHAFFPVRSNGWAEIYFGNVDFRVHPAASTTGLYQQVGEVRFVEQLKGEIIQYIRRHPGQFVWMSLQRWIRFWFAPMNFLPLTLIAAFGCWVGVVLLLRNLCQFAVPFVAAPIFYPIMFSMTHTEARYRHPIEPVMYLLAAYAGCELYDRCRKRGGSAKVEPPGDDRLPERPHLSSADAHHSTGACPWKSPVRRARAR